MNSNYQTHLLQLPKPACSRAHAAAAAKSCQSCPTLCDPIDSSPPGSQLWDSPGKNTGVGYHFLLQCMKVKSESELIQSCPILWTPWTAAYQAPRSMGYSRQEYWSGVPCIYMPSLLSLPPTPHPPHSLDSHRALTKLPVLYSNF